jgi:hypothetical protein
MALLFSYGMKRETAKPKSNQVHFLVAYSEVIIPYLYRRLVSLKVCLKNVLAYVWTAVA